MTIIKTALKKLLDEFGIKKGDTLLVHSGMSQFTSFADEEISPLHAAKYLHEALCETVGANGTIVAPGFFYDYARKGKPFIVEKSPPDKDLGLYPSYFFRQAGCKRSLNPLANLMAIGPKANEICAHRSAISYGHTSPWARLVELDAKVLIIGRPFIMTFVHHVEAIVGVPHIYNKIFHTPVIVDGEKINLPVICSVRYLDFEISYHDDRYENDLIAAGALQEKNINGLQARCGKLTDLQNILSENLAKDSAYSLTKPPAYKAGKIPDDSKYRD